MANVDEAVNITFVDRHMDDVDEAVSTTFVDRHMGDVDEAVAPWWYEFSVHKIIKQHVK